MLECPEKKGNCVMSLLAVVIPAYNEEASLRSFLPKVVEYCETKDYRLVVVNDGSEDETGQIINDFAANNKLLALHHKVNRGVGAAVKTGILSIDTEFTITIDADGQHFVDDIGLLFKTLMENNADMVVGCRNEQTYRNFYRSVGKSIIRLFARILMPMQIVHDLNSGMRIFRTDLAKEYLNLCPESFAFCDIFTLIFISRKHLVLEESIRAGERIGGKSTASTRTAFETIMEILNILVLFNPMRIFLPLSLISVMVGLAWGVFTIMSKKHGISVGAMLFIVVGIISFFFGLIAELLCSLRKLWERSGHNKD